MKMSSSLSRFLPLNIYICSWAHGIGGGAAKMESYYMNKYNETLLRSKLISLIPRDNNLKEYDPNIKYQILSDENKFSELVNIFNDADIVQFQGSFDPLVCEAAKEAKVPFLIEIIHNIETGGLFENIDLSICVSKAVEDVQNKNHNFLTINNGIDLEQFKFSNYRNINRDKIIFLQVANRSKVFLHLEEIARLIIDKYDNVEFWIVGREQNFLSTKNIKYFGIVDNISELYQKADYLFFHSPNEPFGLALIEGMSCGCIPIVSKNKVFSEIIKDSENGFFIEENSNEGAANFLEKIITSFNEDENAKIRNLARKTVEDDFSIDHCIEKYEKAIINLCENNIERLVKRERNYKLDIIEANGNALIGEAIYAFQSSNINRVYNILETIVDKNKAITNSQCIMTAIDFIQFAFLNKEINLAVKVINYIIINYPEFRSVCIEKWYQFLNTQADNDVSEFNLNQFSETLLNYALQDIEICLSFIEILLRIKHNEKAKLFLKSAIEKTKNELDLKNYYTDWLYKIAPLRD